MEAENGARKDVRNLSVRSVSRPLEKAQRFPAVDLQMTEVFAGASMMTVDPGETLMKSVASGEIPRSAPDAVWTTIADLEGDSTMTAVLDAAWTSLEPLDAVMMTGVLEEVVMMIEVDGGELMTPGLGSLWAGQVRMVWKIKLTFFMCMIIYIKVFGQM